MKIALLTIAFIAVAVIGGVVGGVLTQRAGGVESESPACIAARTRILQAEQALSAPPAPVIDRATTRVYQTQVAEAQSRAVQMRKEAQVDLLRYCK